MSKKSFIDSVGIGSPCSEDWNKMVGSSQVRACEHCAKDVNNISEMTRKDAKRLVRASDGNICIRYMQHPVTKRPVFANQLHQITRRAPGIAAGVMTASMSLSTMAYAQSDSAFTKKVDQRVELSALEKPLKPAPEIAKADGDLAGTITDQQGAVIPNCRVNLINKVTNESLSTSTNEEGRYSFDSAPDGQYEIRVSSPGFRELVISDVAVAEGRDSIVDGRLDVANFAMMGDIAVSRDYSTALARAVDNDDPEEVRDLIAKGANVNGKDENYNNLTPLFIAVENGNLEIVQMLLNAGAKVNVRDKSRQTALMRLDIDATPELIDLLVRHGVKLNLSDDEGNTAINLASGGVSTEVLRSLINAGADVNLANREGKTPLMTAAESGHLENVRLLLESGANANARDKEGENAWDYAEGDEIEQLLVSYGAEARPDEPEETSSEDPKIVISRR